MSRYIHKDVKEFIEIAKIKAKIVLKTASFDEIDKYAKMSYDARNLFEKYNYTMTQEWIDRFKDRPWFDDVFLKYVKEDLLLDPINKELLNKCMINHSWLFRKEKVKNKEFAIKLIKMEVKTKIESSLLKENNYELLKLIIENDLEFVLDDRELIIKAIELGSQKLIDKVPPKMFNDKELVYKAVENKIIVPNYYENYNIIKLYLENDISISLYKCKKFLKNIWKDYKGKYLDYESIKILIDNGTITSFDFLFNGNQYEDIVYSFIDLDSIVKYAKELNDKNLDTIYDVFNSKSNVEPNIIKEIINKGYPNIINNIDSKYLTIDIVKLAIENGYCNINKIKNIELDIDTLKVLGINIITKYKTFESYEYPFNCLKIDENDNEEIKQKKEQAIMEITYLSVTKGNVHHLSDIYKICLNKLLTKEKFYDVMLKQDKDILTNFYDYALHEKTNSELVKTKFIEAYKLNKINLEHIYFVDLSFMFNTIDSLKEGIDKGYQYIFQYVKLEHADEILDYTIQKGYKFPKMDSFFSKIRYYDSLISKAIQIDINYVRNKKDIDDNIDLIYEEIESGYIPNEFIINYLLQRNDKKYIEKIIESKINNNGTLDYTLLTYLINNPIINNNDLLEQYIFSIDWASKLSDCLTYYLNGYTDFDEKYVVLIIKKFINMKKEKFENSRYNFNNYFNLYDLDDDFYLIKNVVNKNESILDELIIDNFEYIKFASDDYLVKRNIEISKISSSKLLQYVYLPVVQKYVSSLTDETKVMRLIKENKKIVGLINPGIYNQNPFLNKYLLETEYMSSEFKRKILTDYNFFIENPKMIKFVSYDMLKNHPDLFENVDLTKPLSEDILQYIIEDNDRIAKLLNNNVSALFDIPSNLLNNEENRKRIIEVVAKKNVYIGDKVLSNFSKLRITNPEFLIELLKAIDLSYLKSWDIEKIFTLDELIEISLLDENLFNKFIINNKLLFSNTQFVELEKYKEYVEKYGFIFKYRIKTKEDIIDYFSENNPKKNIYELYLFDKNTFTSFYLNNDDWKKNYKPPIEVEQYIEYVKKYGFIFYDHIKNLEDIYKYFENGSTEELYKKALFDNKLFNALFSDEEWKNHYNPAIEVEQYIEYVKKYGFIFYDHIKNLEDINKYFKNGPTEELYKKALFDNKLFYVLFSDDEWKNHYNPALEVEQYIEYVKKYGFKLYSYIKNSKDINEYFNDKGIKQSFANKLFVDGDWDLLNDDLIVLSKTQSKSIYFYKKMNTQFRDKFKNIILDFFSNLEEEYVGAIAKIFIRSEYSNSTEIQHLGPVIISQIYQTVDTPDELINKFNKIEEIFLDNKIPYVAKAFKVFEMLNPNLDFDFSKNSMLSPNLKKYSNKHKKFILFGDLLKCSLESNNRSLKEYLKEIRLGNEIYVSIRDNGIKITDLNDEQIYILSCYIEKLKMLYTFTEEGKNNENIIFSGDMTSDMEVLCKLFKSNDLPDRIIRMFGFFAGVSSFNDLEMYIEHIRLRTDFKNHNKVNNNNLETLEYGDLVKGLGGINYLGNILQNGSVAREFLGDSAGSDRTPLDTDLSMIISKSQESIRYAIGRTAAHGYGPIYLVLKNNDRFNVTRTHDENSEYSKLDLSKYELFYTGVLGEGHYGIRTGFPSSEIDYIVVEYYDSRVGLEIVMNGFYIPVVDMNGNLVFSPKDYDFLRSKMNGLSYYEKDIYNFATDLDCPGYMLNDNKIPSVEEIVGQLQSNNDDISSKREYINELIRRIIVEGPEKINEFKTRISRNILNGSVEFLDTGSTGRGTNVPNDADFDFVMRIDRDILLDNERRNNFVNHIANELGFDANCIQNGNIRKGKIKLPNSDVELEIDITFVSKTNKLEYSTEMCVEDRMTNIKKQSPESYPYVLANIIYAKKFLKAHNVYKPDRSDSTQGGMGGVGVENWILQNGGSFKEAARSFMEVANTCSSYEEFKYKYHVFDFGSNHMAESRDHYPHDDFVWNMNPIGYDKMKQALSNYLTYVDTMSLEEESIHKK